MNPSHSSRRSQLKRLGALGLAAGIGPLESAFAQAYPARPIRWIVPYAPGGGTDVAARTIAKQWEPLLGTNFVMDNKPGGQTIIATQALQTAPADGYTIMVVVDNFPLLPLMFKSLPFDIEKDFEYVSTTVKVPFVLAVRADSPFRSLDQAIAAMRTKGEAISYGTYGVGSTPHLAMEALCDRIGTTLTHVPYQGAAAQIKALLGSEVDIMFLDTSTAGPFLKDGKIRGLGLSVSERLSAFPGIAPLQEQGVANFNHYSWHGVILPRGTPRPVLDKIAETLHKALQSPEIRASFADKGYEIFAGTPDAFQKHVSATSASMRELVNKRNIKITAT